MSGTEFVDKEAAVLGMVAAINAIKANEGALLMSEGFKTALEMVKTQIENGQDPKKFAETIATICGSATEGVKLMAEQIKNMPETKKMIEQAFEQMAKIDPKFADPAFKQQFLKEYEESLKAAHSALLKLSEQECKAPTHNKDAAMRGYQAGVDGTAFTAVVPATGPLNFDIDIGNILSDKLFPIASQGQDFELINAKIGMPDQSVTMGVVAEIKSKGNALSV